MGPELRTAKICIQTAIQIPGNVKSVPEKEIHNTVIDRLKLAGNLPHSSPIINHFLHQTTSHNVISLPDSLTLLATLVGHEYQSYTLRLVIIVLLGKEI